MSWASCSVVDSVTIGVWPRSQASFSNTATALSVQFTNTSQNTSSYTWNFGDGNTSTSPNPVHTYAQPGSYTVKLIARGSCDPDTFIQTITANFAAGIAGIDESNISIYPNPTKGQVNVAVNFQMDAIVLTSLEGKILQTLTPFSNSVQLHTGNLAPGAYFITIKGTNRIISRKLLIIQ